MHEAPIEQPPSPREIYVGVSMSKPERRELPSGDHMVFFTHVGIPKPESRPDIGDEPINEDGIVFHQNRFFVCDGIGGEDDGALATKIFCETVGRSLQENKEQNSLSAVIADGAKAIHTSKEFYDVAGLCYLGAEITKNPNGNKTISGYYVGDVRLCIIRNAFVHEATEDQGPKTWKKRNVIDTHLTHGLEKAHQPKFFSFPLQPGDIIIICTDGVTDNFDAKTDPDDSKIDENANASIPEKDAVIGNNAIAPFFFDTPEEPRNLQQAVSDLMKETLHRMRAYTTNVEIETEKEKASKVAHRLAIAATQKKMTYKPDNVTVVAIEVV